MQRRFTFALTLVAAVAAVLLNLSFLAGNMSDGQPASQPSEGGIPPSQWLEQLREAEVEVPSGLQVDPLRTSRGAPVALSGQSLSQELQQPDVGQPNLIRGRVIDQHGNPAAGVPVRVAAPRDFPYSYLWESAQTAQHLTDQHGNFSIPAVGLPRVKLFVTPTVATGPAEETVDLPQGDEHATLTVPRGARIYGQLHAPEGLEVSDPRNRRNDVRVDSAVVYFAPIDRRWNVTPPGWTSDAGYFTRSRNFMTAVRVDWSYSSHGLPPGEYAVLAMAHGEAFVHHISLTESEDIKVDFDFRTNCSISGVVRRPDGRPAADIRVDARRRILVGGSGNIHSQNNGALTGPDGRYRIELRHGEFDLHARWQWQSDRLGTQQIELEAGQHLEQDIVLSEDLPESHVEVRVRLRLGGKAMEGAYYFEQVHHSQLTTSAPIGRSKRLSTFGSHDRSAEWQTFKGLQPGEATVIVNAFPMGLSHMKIPVMIPPDQPMVTFDFDFPATRVHGKFLPPDDFPVSEGTRASVLLHPFAYEGSSLHFSLEWTKSGLFDFGLVPEGLGLFTVSSEGRKLTQTSIELRNNQPIEVPLWHTGSKIVIRIGSVSLADFESLAAVDLSNCADILRADVTHGSQILSTYTTDGMGANPGASISFHTFENGPFLVKLSVDGYFTWKEVVDCPPGETREVIANLDRRCSVHFEINLEELPTEEPADGAPVWRRPPVDYPGHRFFVGPSRHELKELCKWSPPGTNRGHFGHELRHQDRSITLRSGIYWIEVRAEGFQTHGQWITVDRPEVEMPAVELARE